MTTASWTPEARQRIVTARELQITTRRVDGTLRTWVPIWVVGVGPDVVVRTWFRRDTGWFGRAVRSQQARIRVPGLETDVTVEDIGSGTTPIRRDVDRAYRVKYGRLGTGRMMSSDAAATTLRLAPVVAPVGGTP